MGRSRKRKTRSQNYNIDLAEVGKVVDAVSERPLTEGEQKLLKTCHEILTELLVREPRNNEKSEDVLKDLQDAADAVGAEGPEDPDQKRPRKGGNGRTPREGYPSAGNIPD